MQRLAAVLALSLALAGSLHADERPAPTPDDVRAFVDGVVERELARDDVAGAVVVVVANGAPVLIRGYGWADVEKHTPVDAHTLFRAASISKLFTSLAVLQLVEAGSLDLDADVNRYLDFALPPAHGKVVTLRQLLTHRAGFDERLRDLASPDLPPEPLAQFLQSHVPRRGHVPEGSPSYSNYGFALAGYIVERTSGEPFARYVAEHVFAPLGMEGATFEQPLPAALAPRLSRGYVVASESAQPFEVVSDVSAGALSVDGEGMAHFLEMLLGGGALDGARVLSPEGFARWTAPEVEIAGNALGLAIYESHPFGVRAIGHGGDLSHFHSEIAAFPERGFGVFVAQNSIGRSDRLLRAVLVPALAKRYFASPTPAAAATPAPALAPGHAAEVAGSYMTTRRSDASWLRLQAALDQIVVTANADGTLTARGLKDEAGQPLRWREVAPDRFRSDDGEREIAFVRDAAGRPVELQPPFPGVTYERAALVDTQDFTLALFAPSAAVALGVLLAPLAGGLLRRALGASPAPPRPGLAPWLQRATALAWLASLSGFVAFALAAARNVWRFSRGHDAPLIVAVVGMWLAAGLSLASAGASVEELRTSPDTSLARRAARAVPALAFLALAWFAWHWGLLSNPTRY